MHINCSNKLILGRCGWRTLLGEVSMFLILQENQIWVLILRDNLISLNVGESMDNVLLVIWIILFNLIKLVPVFPRLRIKHGGWLCHVHPSAQYTSSHYFLIGDLTTLALSNVFISWHGSWWLSILRLQVPGVKVPIGFLIYFYLFV